MGILSCIGFIFIIMYNIFYYATNSEIAFFFIHMSTVIDIYMKQLFFLNTLNLNPCSNTAIYMFGRYVLNVFFCNCIGNCTFGPIKYHIIIGQSGSK